MKLNKTFLLCSAAILLILLLLCPFRPYIGREVYPADLPPLVTQPAVARPAFEHPLDLNLATTEELQTLTGIGPVRAQSIVDYRLHNGPFQSVEELTAVDGIDLGILEPIREQICVTIE